MNNEVPIQLSCPRCGKELIIEMQLERDSGLPQQLEELFNNIIGDTPHYCFKGVSRCEDCNEMVVGCITVSSHGIKG